MDLETKDNVLATHGPESTGSIAEYGLDGSVVIMEWTRRSDKVRIRSAGTEHHEVSAAMEPGDWWVNTELKPKGTRSHKVLVVLPDRETAEQWFSRHNHRPTGALRYRPAGSPPAGTYGYAKCPRLETL